MTSRPEGCLIQEWYLPDQWKHFVCCIFLNQTTGAAVQHVTDRFFEICPTPESVEHADRDEVIEIIRPLGLYNRRYEMIRRFSADWAEGKPYDQCFGIGKYATDSYKILVEGRTDLEDVSDHVLVTKLVR